MSLRLVPDVDCDFDRFRRQEGDQSQGKLGGYPDEEG